MRSGKLFISFQDGDGLGTPDLMPPDTAAGTEIPVLDPLPPAGSNESGMGQIILILGVVLAAGVGFAVYRVVRDGAVGRMETYDKATRNGLIAGVAVGVLVAVAAWFISRQNF
ncbi:hypothetical protein [Sandarakinorhabdus sp.]|uniref:hypothetical protein n=1 Tax=Sandarakinorhabdus sp. TaxID=1916663 RepID=UPI003F728F3F